MLKVANNMRSRMTSRGRMVTAQLLTNCANTLHNIHTNARERISQGHVQNRRRATFSCPTLYVLNRKLIQIKMRQPYLNFCSVKG